jgi:hypothetical protein
MNKATPVDFAKSLIDLVKSAAEVIKPLGIIIAALGAVLSALGFQGAQTAEFKFALLITCAMFGLSFVILALLYVPRAPRRLVERRGRVAVALALLTVAAGVTAYRSTYEAHAVDRLAMDEQPTIQHITFDAAGTLMAAEFNSELRVRKLASRQEWRIDNWHGVSNDRLVLRASEPQLTVTRLTEGERRKVTISSWVLGGTVHAQDYELGSSSNNDNQADCVPQDWAPDQQLQQIAIAYSCKTKVVPQLAGGFVEVVQLTRDGTPPPPRRMLPPEMLDHPEVPVGTNCAPTRVAFNEVDRYVIGVYECTSTANRAYHVKRWTYDNGLFASWTPVLDRMVGWTLLGLQQGPDGGSRIAAQRGARVELWHPLTDTESRLVSWLKFEPVYGFAPQNVALSPDGKWAADVDRSATPSGSKSIAIQQFGVWFGGVWRAGVFDPLWPSLQKAQQLD